MDSGTVVLRSGSLVNSGNITDCTAENEGAALLVGKYDSYSVGSPAATIAGGTIARNTSNAGLGVVVAGLGGKLTMEDGEVADNTCVTEGEAVRVKEGGAFTMNGGSITGGNLSGWGSCVRVFEGGTFTMNGGELTGSKCNYGGCVFTSGTTSINNATLNGSTVSKGGVVYVEKGTLSVGNEGPVVVSGGNAAESALEDGLGGGLYVESGQVNLGKFAKIIRCTAGTDGGGMFVENAEVELHGAEISDCTAGDCGGGVFSQGGLLSLNKASVRGNTADYAGGGLCLSPTKARIRGELVGEAIFTGNDAEEGVDIFMDYEGMLLDDSTHAYNAYFGILENLGDGPISVAADEDYIIDEGPRMFASTEYENLDVFEVESDEYEMVPEYGKLYLKVPGDNRNKPSGDPDNPDDDPDVDPENPTDDDPDGPGEDDPVVPDDNDDPANKEKIEPAPETGDHMKGYVIGGAALVVAGGIGLVLARRKMK